MLYNEPISLHVKETRFNNRTAIEHSTNHLGYFNIGSWLAHHALIKLERSPVTLNEGGKVQKERHCVRVHTGTYL